MNEQAFNDLYKEFVNTGYRGSKDDFKVLLQTNPDAFSDGYSAFTSTGYKGSDEDFAKLMGVVNPLKKKDTTESSLEDGSLGLPEYNIPSLDELQVDDDMRDTRVFEGPAQIKKQDERTLWDELSTEAQDATRVRQYPVSVKDAHERGETPIIEENISEMGEPSDGGVRLVSDEEMSIVVNPIREGLLTQLKGNKLLDLNYREQEEAVKLYREGAFTDEELDEQIRLSYRNNTPLYDYQKEYVYNKSTSEEPILDAMNLKDVGIVEQAEQRFEGEKKAEKIIETEEAEVSERIKKQEEAEKAERLSSLEGIDEDLSFLDSDFLSQSTGQVVPELNEKLGKYGIVFSKAIVGGVKMVSPTGESQTVRYGYTDEQKAEAIEEIKSFVKGGGEKPRELTNIEKEASDYVKSKGFDFDYNQQIAIAEENEKINEDLEFIEQFIPYNLLSKEEKERFGKYYSGNNISVSEELKSKMLKRLRVLEKQFTQSNFFSDNNYSRARNEYDTYINKKIESITASAARTNDAVQETIDNLEQTAQEVFGVSLSELRNIKPKNQEEARIMMDIGLALEKVKQDHQNAVILYESANTYYDAKVEKNLQQGLADNLEAFTESFTSSLNTNRAGRYLLLSHLGLPMDTPLEEVAGYIEKAQNAKVGRALWNFQNAKTMAGKMQIFKNDPFEMVSSLGVQMIGQMLPYWKEIVATTAGGAVVGSSTATPFGVAAGAIQGLRISTAAVNATVEYTGVVLEAMRKYGYNPADTKSLEKAINDSRVWGEANDVGLKRAAIIMGVDYISGGVAGRVVKVGTVANRGRKIVAKIGEALIYQPFEEGLGEYLAQVGSGQDVNWTEIQLEAMGGPFVSTPMMVLNTYLDSKRETNREIAKNLMDIDFISKEISSNSRISTWANNMAKLGKISAEENQIIQKNVGLREESRNLLNVGIPTRFKPKKAKALESRVMELLSAREQLSSTANRRSVFSKKISEINSELEDIATTKKLRDKDGETNLDIAGTPLDKRKSVGVYKIKGKEVSKQEFLDKVRKAPVEELDALNPEVRNDIESKSILDELFNGGLKSVKEQFQELDNTERQRFIDEADGDEASAINLFQKSIRENIFDDSNKISDNLFLREQGDTKRENQQRDRITTIATNAAKSISKMLPQVKIVMHNSAQDFNNVTNRRGSGFFSFDDNTIHVNLEDANLRTVPHEVFHAVLFNKLGEEGVASSISNMLSSVRKGLPKNSKIYKRVDEFAKMYEEDDAFIQDEERMSELFGIISSEYKKLNKPSKNAIIKFIQDIARKFGILDIITDTDEAVIDLMNILSEKVRMGEELVEEDVKALEELDNGTNPIGKPTTIRKPKGGGRESKNNFKKSHKYSLVTPEKSFDFMSLIDDISNKKQKVWFWVADQLGIDEELGIDAGPSFAYQKEGDIWASSMPVNEILDAINKSDYLFIISGAPDKSHMFNKAVFDRYVESINMDYNEFRDKILSVGPPKAFVEVLEAHDSWDSLREDGSTDYKPTKDKAKEELKKDGIKSPSSKQITEYINSKTRIGTGRKKFLIAHNLQGTQTMRSPYKKALIEMGHEFLDPNTLRDGFYVDNDFKQNDVMLVLKPTDVREGSNHSTYENTVTGDVVGVPDVKIDALELMPIEMREKYEGQRSKASQSIAPYGKGIKEIESPTGREQRSRIDDATENGQRIITDSDITLFRGTKPKMRNGKPFSVHKIKKGKFAALDRNISLGYKGDKSLKIFEIPAGTTVEVVRLPLRQGSEAFRRNEENAIDASDAQVVKLMTYDASGKEDQYIVKDDDLLAAVRDETPQEEQEQNQRMAETKRGREQKGLINFTEKDAIKYSKIGIEDARTIQAMNNIGLSGVKFTKEGVENKIKESLNKLYNDYDSYLINKDSNGITTQIQNEIDGAEDLPPNIVQQLKDGINNESFRKKYIDKYRETQDETARQWVSYLKESEYSDAFKYLILDAVLTNNYDLKTLKYKKRTNTTIRNITPFDAGTLATLYVSDSKNLLKSYIEVQQENLKNIIKASQIDKMGKGRWLKFDGGPNAQNLSENANSLSQLVQDTYWCTKSNALSQLRDGDFYVYVTGDSPRIAIRMEGDRVGEVRGNASSKQDIEPDMLPIADKFLRDNIPNDSGKKWLDSIEFNKKAKAYLNKIKSDGIGEEEIIEYANILTEGTKYNTDYGENGFITRIKSKFKDLDNIKPEVREYVVMGVGDFNPNKTKYILGDANFRNLNITDLGNLQSIGGNAYFKDSKITDLGNLQSIGGSANFKDSNITDLGNLQSIGGIANFENSKVTDLGNLQSIGGIANFGNSKITDLGNLQSIGSTAYFEYSKITDLGNLQSIGGYADFRNLNITDLGNLQSIGGNAYFRDSKITDLGNLQSIGGSAFFEYSNITDLGNLQSIGSTAYFENSKVTDLGNLQSIGSTAYFENSNITDLGNLQSIGGIANFEGSNITDLGNLQSIGDNAYFRDSKVTDLGNLQSIGGNANFKDSKITDLGNLQSIGGYANFKDSKITDLGNLQSIGGDANFRNLNITDLGNLQSIGGNAYFKDSKITDLGNLQSIGGNAYFRDSKVTDLGNLQSIGGNANFKDSKVTDLGNLQSIGGIAFFEYSNITDLGNLQSIGSTADFGDSKITDLGNLQSIGGSADFEGSNITDLGNLQSIGGTAYFKDSKITDLGNLQSIGGYVYFGELAELKSEWIRRKSETPRGKEQRVDRGAKKRIRTITGQIKNYKSITLNEKQLLVKRFRDLNEGAKNLKAAHKLATKLLLDELSDLSKKGTISTRQLEFILKRFLRVNLLNEDSISKFVDYMANVFEDVEYAEKISKANKKKQTASKNASTTKGIPSGLSIKLKEVFAVNPTMIPKSVFDGYMKLIDMFGDKAVVLSIPEQTTVNKIVDSVLNKIREEESTIPELKARFDGAEKVIDKKTGKIDYAATLKDMLKEQKIINEDDLELMKKYKSSILPREKATPKTDEEIQAEIDGLVDGISKQKISDKAIKDLPDRERRDAARKLRSLLKGELLSQLGVSDLKNISKLINLINNGYYPHFADVVITKLSGLQVDGTVKVIQKAKPLPLEKIFRAFSIPRLLGGKKRSSIYSMIVNNPSAVMDNVIGNFKTQELFETLFKPIRQAIEGYKRDYKDVNHRLDEMKKRVQKSLGRGRLLGSRNAFVMSKYKQMIYLIQKEFENNPENPKVHQASEFIKKTIATIKDGKSNFNKYDADMLQEILDTYSDKDGNIDSKKLYNSFNKVEKESIELIREINNSLLDKAEYTSTIIRGQEFESYNDYVHRIVIDDTGSTDFNIEEYSSGMMVSTRGKSLISRTKAVSALDFDVYRSVERGSKSVLMDYYLTPAVRIGRSRFKNIKKKLMGDDDIILNDLQREVYNATGIAFEEELESLLENTYQSSAGLGEQIASLIKKNGYRAMLAGVRVIPEFLSNISAALILDSKALMEGLKTQKLIFSEAAPMSMKNLKSTMLERVYPSSGLSGRFIDEDVSLKTLATRGNAQNKIKNILYSSWDNTMGRWTRGVGEIQDSIISKPDSIINQPFWFGSFIRSFKEATGKEPDFGKIASNDEAYMNKYKTELDAATKSFKEATGKELDFGKIASNDEAYMNKYKTELDAATKSFKEATGKEPDFGKIASNDEAYMNKYKTELDAATKIADNQTKSIGAAKGEFIGIAANRIKKGDSGLLTFYKTFNGFMTNFIINDYVYARKAIYNLVSRGEMSKRKAAALLSGIITRNMVYFIIGHYSNVVLGELAQYISGEDDEEEKLTFTQVLGKAIAQTFNTYLFGRNAGNVTRSLINIPVEELNKKFGQPLRTGEYDPYKDAIAFVIKSGKAPYEKAGVQDYLLKMTGAYQPFINTANLIGKQFQDKDKKEEDAIQRQKDVRQIRIPLEVLGNLGFIPLYKDVRKTTNDVIYSSMKKSEDEGSSGGTSRSGTSRSGTSRSGTSRSGTSRSE